MRHRRFMIVLLLIVAMSACGTVAAGKWTEEQERAAGEATAARIEKSLTMLEDEDAQKRVEGIVAELVPHTDRPDVTYTVKLIDESDVNAFTIPGGYIYVYKGLLEEAHSDDELAAVIAHEMAHNCTFDALDQAERSKKLFLGGLSAALVAIVLGANTEQISGVITAGSYLQQGVLSHYSIEMERRADVNAIRYLDASHYNPVGLLTFMERLAAGMFDRPQIDWGIYETHPQATERVGYIIEAIYERGLEINRRAVSKWDPPTYESIKPEGAAEDADVDPKTAHAKISLWGEELITLTHPGKYEGIGQRAAAVCRMLTDAVAEGLSLYEVQVEDMGETALITVRGDALLTIDARDVSKDGNTPAMVAQQFVHALARAIHRERLQRRYG